jgi:hypothetical protein
VGFRRNFRSTIYFTQAKSIVGNAPRLSWVSSGNFNHQGHEVTPRNLVAKDPSWYFVSFVVQALIQAESHPPACASFSERCG